MKRRHGSRGTASSGMHGSTSWTRLSRNSNGRRQLMDARQGEPTSLKNRTTVERTSERELVVTRTFNGQARIVFEAWTRPELVRQWWVPKSMGMTLRSCAMDVRVGGKYRLEFEPDGM